MKSHLARWALVALASALIGGIVFAKSHPKGMAPDKGAHIMMTPASMKLMAHVEQVKRDAAKHGKYNCCIKPACAFCAVHMGSCPCAMGAASHGKMPVCRECKGGWEAGEGAMPGVTANEVKAMSMAHGKM